MLIETYRKVTKVTGAEYHLANIAKLGGQQQETAKRIDAHESFSRTTSRDSTRRMRTLGTISSARKLNTRYALAFRHVWYNIH